MLAPPTPPARPPVSRGAGPPQGRTCGMCLRGHTHLTPASEKRQICPLPSWGERVHTCACVYAHVSQSIACQKAGAGVTRHTDSGPVLTAGTRARVGSDTELLAVPSRQPGPGAQGTASQHGREPGRWLAGALEPVPDPYGPQPPSLWTGAAGRLPGGGGQAAAGHRAAGASHTAGAGPVSAPLQEGLTHPAQTAARSVRACDPTPSPWPAWVCGPGRGGNEAFGNPPSIPPRSFSLPRQDLAS